MNLLITGISGMRNRGVEALVVPTIQQLRQRQPDIEINILTQSPDYDRNRLQSHKVNINSESSITSRKKRLLEKIIPFNRTTSLISESSAVIASGGDVFSPEYPMYNHLIPLKLAQKAGVPVIFHAQSISPYKSVKQAQSWLEVSKRAKLITVREKATYKYVTNELGLSTDIVKLVADPAFLLPPCPIEEVDRILRMYGISRERPLVAIATSQGICGFGKGWDYDKHFESWQQVITTIINELNSEILIIPHVQEIWLENDDRILATNLLRAFNYDPRIHIAGADHTASEFKGLIAACDLVIAERMHAAIAGLSSGICTIAIGYSVKAEGIMYDVLGAEIVNQGLLIPMQNFLNQTHICQAVQSIWPTRKEIAKHIDEELPKVKSKASENFDLILEALR
ncbi:polysaccharide pyruvyl transferase family protein [Nodularia spumigena CS-591/12]|nr:polysaccharide pyruvyl transferase family protein [Nodularia spumigena]MDB9303321.1 polysaccharide pyruvyl transferase family protein [Nodularia spumigena CS-591/12]MDB9347606.1 polysaccharide pyruvyl transferase family protein [Nodularia spumigena CS-588/01]